MCKLLNDINLSMQRTKRVTFCCECANRDNVKGTDGIFCVITRRKVEPMHWCGYGVNE